MTVDPAMLVEHSPDAMIFADREGIIRVWNAAATRIFGHDAEAAIGQNLDLIVPERFREQHWTGFDRALAEG
jgi:PAS domain S-box-containing protein